MKLSNVAFDARRNTSGRTACFGRKSRPTMPKRRPFVCCRSRTNSTRTSRTRKASDGAVQSARGNVCTEMSERCSTTSTMSTSQAGWKLSLSCSSSTSHPPRESPQPSTSQATGRTRRRDPRCELHVPRRQLRRQRDGCPRRTHRRVVQTACCVLHLEEASDAVCALVRLRLSCGREGLDLRLRQSWIV